ncbi:hypothetical protein AMECASPLE_023028 [Ameca splendens]|uniref:Uncharacterized protein n=1 Tax=Ameca splendens TaxID=208324 RepID=A0ABV0Y3Y7_9TELE
MSNMLCSHCPGALSGDNFFSIFSFYKIIRIFGSLSTSRLTNIAPNRGGLVFWARIASTFFFCTSALKEKSNKRTQTVNHRVKLICKKAEKRLAYKKRKLV